MENSRTVPPQRVPESGPEGYTRFPGRPVSDDPATGYAALKEGAALVDLSHRVVLRLTGRDPAGLLDAILTNKVPAAERLGVYAALLNQKGRLQTDLRVIKSGEDILVDTEPEGAAAAKEILGRYAPFSRVKVEDLSEADEPWTVLGLYGPRAGELVGGLALAEHESARVEVAGAELLAVGVALPVPGYDLLGPADALRAARERLVAEGAVPVGPDVMETARIEAGVPRFGSDMTPENFPAEAGILERAVSFEKGCYPGQETVARMHYRGHPNRKLYRFSIEGPAPEPGREVFQSEKRVGRITSIAPLPVGGKTLALGYLHRSADPNAPLRVGESPIRPLAT